MRATRATRSQGTTRPNNGFTPILRWDRGTMLGTQAASVPLSMALRGPHLVLRPLPRGRRQTTHWE